METNENKIKFLLDNGWKEHYPQRWVKLEWLEEDDNGRNSYRTESLEKAYEIALVDKDDEEHPWVIIRDWEKNKFKNKREI